MNRKPEITIFTEKEKLVGDKKQTIDVLVRVSPPVTDLTTFKRPSLNLGVALDRSGSMQGPKMHEAREAAKFCVDQLLPNDRFSTVIFDDQVDVLFTSQSVTDKEMFKRGIDRIHSRNSTALHQGWVTAGLQVSEHLDKDAINRVLLITDGQANVGETCVEHIVEQARQLARRGVSTSTIGIGQDFNEDLLLPMAEAGEGNAWHVQEPQDMLKIFETEMRGLLTQIGHGVTLEVKTYEGVAVAEVLNDFEIDSSGRYELPNLRTGTALDIVVRLRVSARSPGETKQLADFEINYTAQDTGRIESVSSSLKVEFASAEIVEKLDQNTAVLKAVQLLMNARARREAIEKMDAGNYIGSIDALQMVAEETFALSSKFDDEDLTSEIDDLNSISCAVRERENDLSSRKRLSYRREAIRKSK